MRLRATCSRLLFFLSFLLSFFCGVACITTSSKALVIVLVIVYYSLVSAHDKLSLEPASPQDGFVFVFCLYSTTASTGGIYQAPSTRAEEMYSPEVFGRGTGISVHII
jgi:hypothetical protein